MKLRYFHLVPGSLEEQTIRTAVEPLVAVARPFYDGPNAFGTSELARSTTLDGCIAGYREYEYQSSAERTSIDRALAVMLGVVLTNASIGVQWCQVWERSSMGPVLGVAIPSGPVVAQSPAGLLLLEPNWIVRHVAVELLGEFDEPPDFSDYVSCVERAVVTRSKSGDDFIQSLPTVVADDLEESL